MPTRLRYLPWDAQPQDLPDVDPAFGIAEAWLPHLSPVGLVASAIPSTEATYSLRTTNSGLGLNVTSTGRRYSRPYFSGQSAYAWLSVLHRDGSGTSTYSILRHASSAVPIQEANSAVRVALWPGGTLRLADYSTPGGVGIANYQNKVTVFAGRVDSAAATLYTLLDGVITASTVTSGVGTLSTTTNPLVFGATESGGEVATPWANLQTLLWFGSIPPEQVLHELMRESWRVFRRRIFVPVSAGGGGSWSVSLTETASASDSLGAATTALVSLIESASAADIIGAATIAAVALTEAASASDTQTASYSATGSGSVTESASASDTLDAANTMLRALTETASADDQLAAATTMLRAISESASASDAATSSYTAAGAAAITETASATDALTAAATLLVTILEAGSATDALTAATTMVRAITEQATAADTVDGALPGSWTVSIEELAAATDAIAAFVAGDLDALARYTIIGRARAFEIRGRQRRNEVPK